MLSKISVLLCITLCIAFSVQSQNLVPNSSFENYSSCPTLTGQTHLVQDWQNINEDGSPDYFNRCFEENGYDADPDIPWNGFGYQESNTGDAYIGLFCYGLNVREYVQTELSSELEAGEYYDFEMYVSTADLAAWATSSLGIYLSETPNEGEGTYWLLNVEPTILNENDNILDDTIGWDLIQGSFQAYGGEKYLVIGNFYNDSVSTAVKFNPSGLYQNQGYVYIDDVSLQLKSPTSSFMSEKSNDVQIYPNPARNFIQIEQDSNSERIIKMCIRDSKGKISYSRQFNEHITEINIDVSQFYAGLYFVSIFKESGNQLSYKLVITN